MSTYDDWKSTERADDDLDGEGEPARTEESTPEEVAAAVAAGRELVRDIGLEYMRIATREGRQAFAAAIWPRLLGAATRTPAAWDDPSFALPFLALIRSMLAAHPRAGFSVPQDGVRVLAAAHSALVRYVAESPARGVMRLPDGAEAPLVYPVDPGEDPKPFEAEPWCAGEERKKEGLRAELKEVEGRLGRLAADLERTEARAAALRAQLGLAEAAEEKP